MRPFFILLVIIATVITSCVRETYKTLQRTDLGGSAQYEIKSMVGCCGCKAILYNVFKNNSISEQFVTETNCGLYEPTKHLFTSDTKGRVTNIRSLVAVTDSSFSFLLTEIDRKALIQLDSIYTTWQSVTKRQIVFADITGFKEGEKIHTPLGVKVAAASMK